MVLRVLMVLALALLVAALIQTFPDIRRYLRIREM